MRYAHAAPARDWYLLRCSSCMRAAAGYRGVGARARSSRRKSQPASGRHAHAVATPAVAVQVEEFYVITWEGKKEQIFEMPTGGAAIMRKGPNLLKLARKEQCLALLTMLRSKLKIDGQFYRVFPNGEVQYLHPKDGVYPEKVNKGREPTNTNMRRIGQNANPADVRTPEPGFVRTAVRRAHACRSRKQCVPHLNQRGRTPRHGARGHSLRHHAPGSHASACRLARAALSAPARLPGLASGISPHLARRERCAAAHRVLHRALEHFCCITSGVRSCGAPLPDGGVPLTLALLAATF